MIFVTDVTTTSGELPCESGLELVGFRYQSNHKAISLPYDRHPLTIELDTASPP
jgi:hypothetical protein